MASRVKDGLHRHGCRQCQKCYEDACGDPLDNRECYQCRSGRPGLFDQLGTFTPEGCCFTSCRQLRRNKANKGFDELVVYRLSPACPWWICETCKRTYPYRKPRQESP